MSISASCRKRLRAHNLPEKPPQEPVELKVANRSIMVFRATLLGETPVSRVKRAKAVIGEALDETDDLTVAIDPIQDSYMVLLGNRRAFIVSPGDVDSVEFASVALAAQGVAANLRLVVAETGEARSLHLILRSLVAAAIVTAVYFAALWGVAYIRRRLLKRLPELMDRHTRALKVGRVQVLEANYLYPLVIRLFWLLRWLVLLLLTYEWLGFVLSRFPYTRPWGESLNNYLLEVADLADRTEGTSRNTLLGIAQVIMLGELAVNRALDRIESPQ